MKRAINFNAGPAAIPQEVLEKAQGEMLDWKGTGMSVMEVSHRSKEYEEMNNHAQASFKEIAGMGDEWKVLFLQGGANLQFTMLPMNFIPEGGKAEYILTGHWAKTALKEAKRFGGAGIASTEKDGVFRSIPAQSEIKVDPASAYVHMTSNNTIFGTQWHYWPDALSAPLIADMSSDIFSRPFPADKFSLIYAGAQKNLGPSGVVAVAVKEAFLAKAKEDLPSMLSYKVQATNNSLFNTPPCFSIYMLDLTLDWIKKMGGLKGMREDQRREGPHPLRRDRLLGRLLQQPRRQGRPLEDERRVPPQERGARGEVREGGQGRRHHRRQGPPLRGRHPLLDLQRQPRREREGFGRVHEGFPEEEQIVPLSARR